MKNMKYLAAGLAVAAILIPATGLSVMAQTLPVNTDDTASEDILIKTQFKAASGEVKDIRELDNGDKYVLVATPEESEIAFIISEKTFLVGGEEIEIGAQVRGFYDANRPMLMIYPMQVQADVFVTNLTDTGNVWAARFDENLVSDDGTLKLNIGEDTKIILPDGTETDDASVLAGRKLVVIYGVSTRSIPAQTTPDTIYVLPEQAEHPLLMLDEDEMPEISEVITCWASNQIEVVVEGEAVEGCAYVDAESGFMVPLRAVAEALGYEVKWDNGKIALDNASMLEVGKDEYYFGRMAPISLGTAPVEVDHVTYVPLAFFQQVIPVNNAYVLENQIVIDNGEIMN